MDNRENILRAITDELRGAEMRQGCTNHSFYAERLLNEIQLFIITKLNDIKANNPYYPATCETESVACIAYRRACDDILKRLEFEK